MGSGWDQRHDLGEEPPEPDTEIRWLLACTIIGVLLLVFWMIAPRLS